MALKMFFTPQLPAGPFRKVVRSIRARLPELNFITLHYTYFILMSLLSALIFWGSSEPFHSVSFIDSLFLATSAITEAGLNTVNLSELTTWQQVILLILMLLGSAIFVSAFIIFVRLKAFERAFINLKKDRHDRRLQRRQTGFSRTKGLMQWRYTRDRGMSSGTSMQQPIGESFQAESDVKNGTTDEEEETLGKSSKDSSDANVDPNPIDGSQTNTQTIHNSPDDRGRLEVKQDLTHAQCPSQSPTGRDKDHEGHAVPPVSPQTTAHIGFSEETRFRRRTDEEYQKVHKPLISFTGVGATARASIRRSASASRRPSIARAVALPSAYNSKTDAYFTSGGWISRNSQFHGLSKDERLLLGGCEYKAVVFLSFLVPFYFVVWQVLGAIALGAWVSNHRETIAGKAGAAPWWVGSFNAVSAFNNSGMSLLDANMVAFQDAVFMLLSMGLFILAGNTAYPIFLRAAVWTIWKLLPDDDPNWLDDRRTLRFLLDHPRRVYTNMFPSRHTWWLALVLVLLNGIDWAFFPILNIGNHNIDFQSPGLEAVDGLFQALAVRSGGFYVVPIPSLRISLQFLYVVMMYFSVYPVVISMRNSNVYEERSLGVFAEDIEDDESVQSIDAKTPETPRTPGQGLRNGLKRRLTDFGEKAAPAPKRETRSYFVRQQVRAQLAHDAWFVVFAVFLILIIEASQFEADPVSFSAFNVIFEVVSAYATVGMSVGVPDNSYSFCGSWHTLSKLILIVVMLRGRHRGLPVAIDHAVQLPGVNLYEAELEDGEKRLGKLERSHTLSSMMSPTANSYNNYDDALGGDTPNTPTAFGFVPILRTPRPAGLASDP